MRIDVIGFDADDTLWHNEPLYSLTEEKFVRLLAARRHAASRREHGGAGHRGRPARRHAASRREHGGAGHRGCPAHIERATVEARLHETEIRNLEHFGYGVKGFTLSMIETAIELTGGQVLGSEIQQIIDYAREMLRAPVHLLDHVTETVEALAGTYRLLLITKGDLFDQQSKIARSGLADHFAYIEVVTEKDGPTYQSVLRKRGIDIASFLMVGNSLRSDVLPIVALGGQAVHIPYQTTWAHETVPDPGAHSGFVELAHIGLLPAFIQQLSA